MVWLKPFAGEAERVKFADAPAAIVALEGATPIVKSGVPLVPLKDISAGTRSSRPFPMPGSLSDAACARAAAACDSLMAVFRLRNSAAPPDTKGALNEVPHPAEYVPKG
jgi:hypothetical protein